MERVLQLNTKKTNKKLLFGFIPKPPTQIMYPHRSETEEEQKFTAAAAYYARLNN
jgi:hypothetical protein